MAQTAATIPDAYVIYVTDTHPHAEDLCWQPLQQIDKEYHLGGKYDNSKLKATYPKGGMLRLKGAPTKREIEKMLGYGLVLAVIDEAQAFPDWLKSLINDVLAPTLADHGGKLLLTGTPNPTCTGYFYEVVEGDPDKYGYHVHKWTVADNPMLPRWAGDPNWREQVEPFLAEERELYRLKETDPVYLRNYKGLWVRSDEEFIYAVPDSSFVPHDPDYTRDLPKVMGIDLGYRDESAYVIPGYDQYRGKVTEVESIHKAQLPLSDIVKFSFDLIEQHSPQKVVIDPSRGGNALVDDINRRFGLVAEVANRKDKADYMRMLNSDIQSGCVLFRRDRDTGAQLRLQQWNTTYTREKEGVPADLHDAFLYAWRACYHYIHVAREEIPKQGTKEYAEYEENKMEEYEQELEEMQDMDENYW